MLAAGRAGGAENCTDIYLRPDGTSDFDPDTMLCGIAPRAGSDACLGVERHQVVHVFAEVEHHPGADRVAGDRGAGTPGGHRDREIAARRERSDHLAVDERPGRVAVQEQQRSARAGVDEVDAMPVELQIATGE